jgi:hypothetical protein
MHAMTGVRVRGDVTMYLLAVAAVLHLAALTSIARRQVWPPADRLWNDVYNRPGPAADFFAVYHAGRQVLTGRDPYSHDEVPEVTPYFAPFRYPPGVAFTVGVSFAWAKPWLAYAAWLAILELLLMIDLVIVWAWIARPRRRRLVAAGWLGFGPLLLELWMGQFTFAAASLVFIATWAWRERAHHRVWRGAAAALWAIAAALKLFPLALAPRLARDRRWTTLAFGAGLLAAALAWLAWHPDAAELFWRLNVSEVDVASYHAGNHGLQAWLYAVISALGGVDSATWRAITATIAIALCAIAGVAMVRGDDVRRAAAIGLLLLPLVSKHAWEHHHVVALPAMTLLVVVWSDRSRWLEAIACAWIVLALPSLLVVLQSGPADWHPERTWSHAARIAYHAPKPLAIVALFALAVVDTHRSRSRTRCAVRA